MFDAVDRIYQQRLTDEETKVAFETLAAQHGITPDNLLASELIDFFVSGETKSDFQIRLETRQRYLKELSDEMLARWFQHNPQHFISRMQPALFYGSPRYGFTLPQNSAFEYLRAAVHARMPGTPFDLQLFKNFATREEWHARVRHLLTNIQEGISQRLEEIHPTRNDVELDDELQEALIRVHGDAVMHYLNFFSSRRFTKLIQNALDQNTDSEAALKAVSEIRQQNWAQFWRMSCVWAREMYKRNAVAFGKFITQNIDPKAQCLGELTAWARRDGYTALFSQFAARWDNRAYWNHDLREVLGRTEISFGSLMKEMERLDIRRNGGWYVTHTFIDDDNAAALYRRGAEQFREYIWRYIPRYDAGGYTLLIQAAQHAGDSEFFIRVFRRTATGREWTAEMERLLARDLSADQILPELEKRKPARTQDVDPKILHRFLQRYGDAVLPFFENYIDWTTPERLEALFALNLPGGELQRELQTIARRQPVEFAARAEHWALRLYDINADYFTPFIVRNISWQSRDAGKQLLERLEADGRYDSFETLFPRLYRSNDWEEEIANLIQTENDEEELFSRLQRRTSRWTTLSDKVAAALYQRDRQRFRAYILEHLSDPRYSRHPYKKLEQVARQAEDAELLRRITKGSSERDPRRVLPALLNQNMPYVQFEQKALEELAPEGLYTRISGPLIRQIVERYGDAAMPTLIADIQRRYYGAQDPAPDELKPFISTPNYYRLILTQHNTVKWLNELWSLVDENVSEETFAVGLTSLTPKVQFGSLPDALAAALYLRAPSLANTFVQKFIGVDVYTKLFGAAQERGDGATLDNLTYLAMTSMTHRNIKEADAQEVQPFIARLEHLYIQSPTLFIGHAAAILRHVPPRWSLSKSAGSNPLWEALIRAHPEEWQRSPAGIRDLFESPNMTVQVTALDLLSQSNRDSAARTVENLRGFRVMLLGDTFKDTKRKALACLEAAAQAGPEYLDAVLPLMRETVDFTAARRAIPDEIAVAIARLLARQPAFQESQ